MNQNENGLKARFMVGDMKAGLDLLAKTAPTKHPLPVLSNVLISTDNQFLRLSTTNLETATTVYVNARNYGTGAITVPFKQFRDYIALMNQGEHADITLNPENQTLRMKQGETYVDGRNKARDVSNWKTISPDEFPAIPNRQGSNHLGLLQARTAKLLARHLQTAINITNKSTRTKVLILRFHSGNQMSVASQNDFMVYESPRVTLETCETDIELRLTIESAKVLIQHCQKVESHIAFYHSAESNHLIWTDQNTETVTHLEEPHELYDKTNPHITHVAQIIAQDLRKFIALAGNKKARADRGIKLTFHDNKLDCIIAASKNRPELSAIIDAKARQTCEPETLVFMHNGSKLHPLPEQNPTIRINCDALHDALPASKDMVSLHLGERSLTVKTESGASYFILCILHIDNPETGFDVSPYANRLERHHTPEARKHDETLDKIAQLDLMLLEDFSGESIPDVLQWYRESLAGSLQEPDTALLDQQLDGVEPAPDLPHIIHCVFTRKRLSERRRPPLSIPVRIVSKSQQRNTIRKSIPVAGTLASTLTVIALVAIARGINQ